MSTPSLSDHPALVAADPALAGHSVVAGLVVAVDALREEIVGLRRQLARHSSNSGQPPSQDGPAGARAAGGWPAGPCGHDPGPSEAGTGRGGP